MSMKKLADKVAAELNERMEGYTDSRQPSNDEVGMAALVCRVQELEGMLHDRLELIRCGIGGNYSGDPFKNELYTSVRELLD